MKIISHIDELLQERSQILPPNKVGFVPTMGYLHAGHLSLVKQACAENDKVIVSIFVNPKQFGPHEDFSTYPQDIKHDAELLEELGVDIVFTPNKTAMYPKEFQTYIDPGGPLVTEVEGAIRPGHFKGVATIVLKLFNLMKPTNVYFGQKDAQQALMIKRMLHDLNLDITMHILPTIREKDGLAMSSRNIYLNKEARQAAPILYQALTKAKKLLATSAGQHSDILKNVITKTIEKEPLVKLEYIEMRNPETFEEEPTIQAPLLILIAAKVGKTRLIDNFLLRKDGTWDIGVIEA